MEPCVDNDEAFSVVLQLPKSGACLSSLLRFIFWSSFLAEGRGDLVLIVSAKRPGDFFLLLCSFGIFSGVSFGDLLLLLLRLLSLSTFGDLLRLLLLLLSPSGLLLLLLLAPSRLGDLLLSLLTGMVPGDMLRRLLFPFSLGLVSVDLVDFELLLFLMDFEDSSAFDDVPVAGLYATLRLLGLFLVEGVGSSTIRSGKETDGFWDKRRALTVGGVGGATIMFIDAFDL